jgi:hypothetical protein
MSYASLRKISRQTNVSNIGVDQYYELKYKLQFISSVGVIVIAVAGFFGLDKYENFVKEFKSKTDSLDIKLNEYDKKISLLDSNIIKYDTKINAYDNSLKKLDLSKIQFSKAMIASNNGLLQLKDSIDIIKKRNILDKSFYIIDNLKVKNTMVINNTESGITKFYFKDMYTTIGDKVPEFEKAPVTFVIPQSPATIQVLSITKDYIEVVLSSATGTGTIEPETYAFGLLIARKLR